MRHIFCARRRFDVDKLRWSGRPGLVSGAEADLHSSLAIANEFLKRAQRESVPLSNMHVQKLVYLAHGWSLAVNGRALIEDDIEAWEFGPVIRKLYDALRQYKNGPIARLIRWDDDTPFGNPGNDAAQASLDRQEEAVLDMVWNTYKKFQAFQLSALTHEPGSPWSNAFENGRNKVIDTNSIWDYFARIASRND